MDQPSPVTQPVSKPNILKPILIGLGIFIFLSSLATAGYLYTQNRNLQRQLALSPSTPTPIPTTTSQLTYINSKFDYSLDYTRELATEENSDHSITTFFSQPGHVPKIIIIVNSKEPFIKPSETTTINSINWKIFTQSHSCNDYNCIPNSVTYSTYLNKTRYDVIFIADDSANDNQTQILSTFKFLD